VKEGTKSRSKMRIRGKAVSRTRKRRLRRGEVEEPGKNLIEKYIVLILIIMISSLMILP
jgi:hypothetical protein